MSSGFVTESELADRRRARQEEWEKVRKPDQPMEAPEEEYDHRSLFDRLQEQKQKRDLEYEEAHRLKNMIKGLDDDEVEFLELVDRSKLEEERKKSAEEEREMAEFRREVAGLHEQSLDDRIDREVRARPLPKPPLVTGRSSQSKLLAGAVVKRKSDSEGSQASIKRHRENGQDLPSVKETTESPENNEADSTGLPKVGAMTCVGVLPGLGHYGDSSDERDSDDSTDVEERHNSKFDLIGRKIVKKKQPEQ